MRIAIAFSATFLALASIAGADEMDTADVLFLGEQHDNPAHHVRQAEIVQKVAPAAIVFEMLTPQQAALVAPDLLEEETALEKALGWNQSGWPDFSMYYPIFTSAAKAEIYGAALPREQARRVMGESVSDVFGDAADEFGLINALPDAQQMARETLQLEAHCNAMPAEMLPIMVNIQRLRDAKLAQQALDALQQTGGPVVVITGNGHARLDWGAPAALRRVAPDVRIFALGQGETAFGAPDGGFDRVEISADVERGDPCEAFRKDG